LGGVRQTGLRHSFVRTSNIEPRTSAAFSLSLIFAPRNTFSAWTSFDLPHGLEFNIGGRYYGKTFADNDNVAAALTSD